jgi:hypothetical protein
MKGRHNEERREKKIKKIKTGDREKAETYK